MNSHTGEIFGRRHAVDITLMILEKGEIILTEFSKKDWTTTNKRLSELESYGLIRSNRRVKGRAAAVWSLTDLGLETAMHLKAIEDRLSEVLGEYGENAEGECETGVNGDLV